MRESAKTAKNPVIIRKLPGAAELENKLLLYGLGTVETDRLLEAFSRDTFGIAEEATRFSFPVHYTSLPEFSDERRRIEDEWDDHEEQFETSHLTDDEIVEYFKEQGLDFSDERGQPLRCTIPLCRQAEAAAKGRMGKMPNPQNAGAARWAESLEADAEAWRKRKNPASNATR